jgi:hypothetical protein
MTTAPAARAIYEQRFGQFVFYVAFNFAKQVTQDATMKF